MPKVGLSCQILKETNESLSNCAVLLHKDDQFEAALVRCKPCSWEMRHTISSEPVAIATTQSKQRPVTESKISSIPLSSYFKLCMFLHGHCILQRYMSGAAVFSCIDLKVMHFT
jgi:hypothetical protein